jgi:hypothetical protein
MSSSDIENIQEHEPLLSSDKKKGRSVAIKLSSIVVAILLLFVFCIWRMEASSMYFFFSFFFLVFYIYHQVFYMSNGMFKNNSCN